MKDHYGLDDEAMERLATRKVGVADLYRAVGFFEASETQVTKLSLFYYIDNLGDFTENNRKTDLIAMEVFNRLPAIDKIEIGNYLEWAEVNIKR